MVATNPGLFQLDGLALPSGHMGTSHADIIATIAACVAAGGASYAALITGKMRRTETAREQEWHDNRDQKSRALDRAERNSDWLKEQRSISFAEVIEQLRELIRFHDERFRPAYAQTPIGHLEDLHAEFLVIFLQTQTAAIKAALTAPACMRPILADVIGIQYGVFTPYPTGNGFPVIAGKRIKKELQAISHMLAGIAAFGRASLLAPDPDLIAVPDALPARSGVDPTDSEAVIDFIRRYQVMDLTPDPRYEVDDEVLEALRENYPHWSPVSLCAVVIDDREQLTLAVRRSLPNNEKDALRALIARHVERGMHDGPAWRDGSQLGERIYLYP